MVKDITAASIDKQKKITDTQKQTLDSFNDQIKLLEDIITTLNNKKSNSIEELNKNKKEIEQYEVNVKNIKQNIINFNKELRDNTQLIEVKSNEVEIFTNLQDSTFIEIEKLNNNDLNYTKNITEKYELLQEEILRIKNSNDEFNFNLFKSTINDLNTVDNNTITSVIRNTLEQINNLEESIKNNSKLIESTRTKKNELNNIDDIKNTCTITFTDSKNKLITLLNELASTLTKNELEHVSTLEAIVEILSNFDIGIDELNSSMFNISFEQTSELIINTLKKVFKEYSYLNIISSEFIKDVEILINDIQNTKTQFNRLENINKNDASLEIDNLEKKIEENKVLINEIIDKIETSINTIKENLLNDQTQKLDNLNTKYLESTKKSKEIKEYIDKLKAKQLTLTKQIEFEENKINNPEQEINLLKYNNTLIEEDIKNQNKEIKDIEDKIAALEEKQNNLYAEYFNEAKGDQTNQEINEELEGSKSEGDEKNKNNMLSFGPNLGDISFADNAFADNRPSLADQGIDEQDFLNKSQWSDQSGFRHQDNSFSYDANSGNQILNASFFKKDEKDIVKNTNNILDGILLNNIKLNTSNSAATEKAAKERIEQEEAEKLEKERIEQEEAEKLEKERIEQEEAEKLAQEKVEEQRIAKELAQKAEVAAKEKADLKKAEAEKAEEQRIAKELAQKAEVAAKEKADLEKAEAEKAEEQRIAKELAQKSEVVAKEKADLEKAEAEKAEEQRIAKELAQKSEVVAKEKADLEKAEAEKAEEQRIAKELAQKAEAEKLAQEKEVLKIHIHNYITNIINANNINQKKCKNKISFFKDKLKKLLSSQKINTNDNSSLQQEINRLQQEKNNLEKVTNNQKEKLENILIDIESTTTIQDITSLKQNYISIQKQHNEAVIKIKNQNEELKTKFDKINNEIIKIEQEQEKQRIAQEEEQRIAKELAQKEEEQRIAKELAQEAEVAARKKAEKIQKEILAKIHQNLITYTTEYFSSLKEFKVKVFNTYKSIIDIDKITNQINESIYNPINASIYNPIIDKLNKAVSSITFDMGISQDINISEKFNKINSEIDKQITKFKSNINSNMTIYSEEINSIEQYESHHNKTLTQKQDKLKQLNLRIEEQNLYVIQLDNEYLNNETKKKKLIEQLNTISNKLSSSSIAHSNVSLRELIDRYSKTDSITDDIYYDQYKNIAIIKFNNSTDLLDAIRNEILTDIDSKDDNFISKQLYELDNETRENLKGYIFATNNNNYNTYTFNNNNYNTYTDNAIELIDNIRDLRKIKFLLPILKNNLKALNDNLKETNQRTEDKATLIKSISICEQEIEKINIQLIPLINKNTSQLYSQYNYITNDILTKSNELLAQKHKLDKEKEKCLESIKKLESQKNTLSLEIKNLKNSHNNTFKIVENLLDTYKEKLINEDSNSIRKSVYKETSIKYLKSKIEHIEEQEILVEKDFDVFNKLYYCSIDNHNSNAINKIGTELLNYTQSIYKDYSIPLINGTDDIDVDKIYDDINGFFQSKKDNIQKLIDYTENECTHDFVNNQPVFEQGRTFNIICASNAKEFIEKFNRNLDSLESDFTDYSAPDTIGDEAAISQIA